MTTWAHPVDPMYHPWLQSPARKRKARPVDERGQLKRRKYSELERGFAHLSLNPSSSHAPLASSSRQGITQAALYGSTHTSLENEYSSIPRTQLPSVVDVTSEISSCRVPTTLPSSVEEPISADIKMRSWYEPEKDRIIITDLDEFNDDTESTSDIIVSRAALDHIKASATRNVIPHRQLSDVQPCTALVLYKPVFQTEPTTNKEEKHDEEAPAILSPPLPDDDVMDIDP